MGEIDTETTPGNAGPRGGGATTGRLHLPLTTARAGFLEFKAKAEAAAGKRLNYDEAVARLLDAVDLERLVGRAWIIDELRTLARRATERNQHDDANLLTLFTDLLSDAQHGRLTIAAVEDALLAPGGGI